MGRRRSRVISWNGIVTYGAMAMGAPLGVLCFAWGGLQGLALTVMGVALLALPRPSVKTNKGNPLSFRAVLGRVWLYGMALALASSRRLLPYFMMLKAGMAPPLRSRYLASHLLARVFFPKSINILGVFNVAMIALAWRSLVCYWLGRQSCRGWRKSAF